MSAKGIEEGFLGEISTFRVQGGGTLKGHLFKNLLLKVASTQSSKHKYTTQDISRLSLSWVSEKSFTQTFSPHAIQ